MTMLATRPQTRFGAARQASVPAAGSASAAIRRAPLALPQIARAPCMRGLRIPAASAASPASSEVPAFPTLEAQQQDVKLAGAPGFLKQMLANVVKFVSLGAVALVMAMAQPSAALASSSGRSGGRVGGFHGGSSMSASSSTPATTYSSSRTTVIVQSTPTVSFGFMPVIPFGFGGYGYSSSSGLVTLLLVVFLMWAAISIFNSFNRRDDDYLEEEYEDVLPITVTKLQVGLLSSARHIKSELNTLAERADTSRPEGLQMVLQETVLSLLRNPEYCVYADANSEVVRGPEEAEQRFSSFSLQERSKIGQETLTNYSGMSRNGSNFSRTSLTAVDELLVVTIMVAAEADLQIPKIRNANDLKQALSALGGVSAAQVMGVELLWTPQAEADYLTRDDVMRDYPNLVPL